jgi:hypothetical protein
LGRIGRKKAEAVKSIEKLLEEAQQFDVLDRGEILCASLLASPATHHADVRRAKLAELLLQLPPATVEQLRRLEALPSD